MRRGNTNRFYLIDFSVKLLPADEGGSDHQIAEALDIGRSTIERVRRRFVPSGVEGTIVNRRPRGKYVRKLDGPTETDLIALVCGAGPEGS